MGQDLVKNSKVSGSYESLSFKSPKGFNISASKFSDAEMRNLIKLFNSLAALSPQDNNINRTTFEHYFPLGGILAKRLFVAFDKNKNGLIDLQEFIDGMTMCLQGSLDDKYQIAFEMFDLDGTNGVSAEELYVVLKSVLMAATRFFPNQEDPVISQQDYSQIELDQLAHCIVKDAFLQQAADLNEDNKMTLKVFKSWIEKHPFVLDSIFGQTCLKDKTTQYGRLSEENLYYHTKNSSSSVKKQTWVISKKDSDVSKQVKTFDGSYAKADYLWSPVFPQLTSKPSKRGKLAACLVYDSVYLYGGRGICTSLKDFWRYDIGENCWHPVQDRGNSRPSYLQEHTMLPYKDSLVLFGGEFTSLNETPLWLFNTNTSTWTKPSAKHKGPTNRRGHSAVISGDSMYIFGGYVDLRGATKDLWKYEFTTNTWTREKSPSKSWPSPRYSHSAAVFDKSMVIFGGLEEMQCKNDMWLWNMASRKWTKIKGRNSPPPLFGHSSVKVGDGMLVFGGESTDGTMFNTMWRFNFDSLSWSAVNPKGMISPPPRSHHALIQIPDFRFSFLRPTSSRSAPPCTPAYDRGLPSVSEEKEPLDSNESSVKNITSMVQTASLGSLDSTALLSNTEDELVKVRLNPNVSGSLDSLVTKIGLQETENMSMVNHERTLSQESILYCRNNKVGLRKEILTGQNGKVSVDPNRLLPPGRLGTGRTVQTLRQQFKPESAECLSPYSKSKSLSTSLCQPATFPEVTSTGVINLMVFGGMSKRGVESSDRSIDMWKCSINPERLSQQQDYEEIKRELSVLKMIEFSSSLEEQENKEATPKSLEMLFMDKNKRLQSENTNLKVENSELSARYQDLNRQYKEAVHTVEEQKELITQLECDLLSVNALPTAYRGQGEGQAGPPSETELVASAVQHTMSTTDETTDKSAADSLLPIVASQRERFKLRNIELETQTRHQQQQISVLQNEVDSLRSDNVKLYEKIKFLESYPTKSSSGTDEEAAVSRYSSQYEQRLDPFAAFNQREKQQRYMGLSPHEKVTLNMGRFLLGNKMARTISFFYLLLLHILVFLVLYKMAHTESCKRDTASECVKRFAQHMHDVHHQ